MDAGDDWAHARLLNETQPNAANYRRVKLTYADVCGRMLTYADVC